MRPPRDRQVMARLEVEVTLVGCWNAFHFHVRISDDGISDDWISDDWISDGRISDDRISDDRISDGWISDDGIKR
jgi:hypothetical protein